MFRNSAFDTMLPAEHGSAVSCSFSISKKLHVLARVELCNFEVKSVESRNLVVAGLTRGNAGVVLTIRENVHLRSYEQSATELHSAGNKFGRDMQDGMEVIGRLRPFTPIDATNAQVQH